MGSRSTKRANVRLPTTVKHVARSCVFAGFQLGGVIGEGASAMVYIAKKHNRQYAIKIYATNKSVASNHSQAYRSEVKALKKLRECQNVVQIHDHGTWLKIPFIVLDLMPNGTLADALKSRIRPFSETESLHIIRQVAIGIQQAHDKGICHADLKPSNILISSNGDVFVSDFGICRTAAANPFLAQNDGPIGTWLYMAPEQYAGQSAPTSDIYAMSVILYELLIGHCPWGKIASSTLLVSEKTNHHVPSPLMHDPSITRSTCAIIGKAGNKDSRLRHQTAREFIDDIDRAISAASVITNINISETDSPKENKHKTTLTHPDIDAIFDNIIQSERSLSSAEWVKEQELRATNAICDHIRANPSRDGSHSGDGTWLNAIFESLSSRGDAGISPACHRILREFSIGGSPAAMYALRKASSTYGTRTYLASLLSASAYNSSAAMKLLGDLCGNGTEISERSRSGAIYWYEQAAKLGCESAEILLAQLLLSMEANPSDNSRGETILRSYAKKKYLTALQLLGSHLIWPQNSAKSRINEGEDVLSQAISIAQEPSLLFKSYAARANSESELADDLYLQSCGQKSFDEYDDRPSDFIPILIKRGGTDDSAVVCMVDELPAYDDSTASEKSPYEYLRNIYITNDSSDAILHVECITKFTPLIINRMQFTQDHNHRPTIRICATGYTDALEWTF